MGYESNTPEKDELMEIVNHFLNIIREKYHQSESGRIHGYLLMYENGDLLTRKEVRKLRVRQEDECPLACLGKDMSNLEDPQVCFYMNIIRTYQIHHFLRLALKEYPFKRIDLMFSPEREYKYYKNKFLKYRHTGYHVPFIIVDLIW